MLKAKANEAMGYDNITKRNHGIECFATLSGNLLTLILCWRIPGRQASRWQQTSWTLADHVTERAPTHLTHFPSCVGGKMLKFHNLSLDHQAENHTFFIVVVSIINLFACCFLLQGP